MQFYFLVFQDQILKDNNLKKERLITKLNKLMNLKQENECFSQCRKN